MSTTKPGVQWRDTGLTPFQVIKHKGAGVIEVCVNVGHLYPKMYTTAVLLGCAVALGCAYAYIGHTTTKLSLGGSELEPANQAYSSIHSAEDLMEDFSPGSGRAQAATKAEVDLARMRAMMRSRKGIEAERVFSYYLLAVKAMPLRDFQCVTAKVESHKAEDRYVEGEINNEELTSSEVAYFRCRDERSKISRLLTACQEEAFTFVTGTSAPPVSLCVYRHDSPELPRP